MLSLSLGVVTLLLAGSLGLLWRVSRALDQARRENERRAEFVAHTSHELRTPLNSIINIPEALLELFQEEEVAECERCRTRFVLEASDRVDAASACLECHAVGQLRLTRRPTLKGDASKVVRGLSNMM